MITIKIKTDNAAFGDDAGPECARILRKLADTLEHYRGPLDPRDWNNSGARLRDYNGNTVGAVTVTRSR